MNIIKSKALWQGQKCFFQIILKCTQSSRKKSDPFILQLQLNVSSKLGGGEKGARKKTNKSKNWEMVAGSEKCLPQIKTTHIHKKTKSSLLLANEHCLQIIETFLFK